MNAVPHPLLDHVAVAVESLDAGEVLTTSFGAVSVGGGDAPGFRTCQWQFTNGMRVELLEPHRVDENDFLRRFLDAGGPGAHHLTFRVPELDAAVERLEGAGFPLLYTRTTNPDWLEGFVHPKHAFGTVVQLAEYTDKLVKPDPSPVACGTALSAVVLEVQDVDGALSLFAGVLAGVPSDDARDALRLPADAQVLTWPATGALAIVPARGDAGGRGGRITRLVADRQHAAGCDHASSGTADEEVVADPRLGTPVVVRPTVAPLT